MKLFLFEFITGGGLLGENAPPSGSLLREGAAMAAALATDFSRLSDVEVVALRDARLGDLDFPGCRIVDVARAEQERDTFDRLSAESDWTLVIAPEFDGILLDRCRRVESGRGRLLGLDSTFVALASDKHRCARQLNASGVPTPQAVFLAAGQPLPTDFPYPAVIKPNDGAGSLGVRSIDDPCAAPKQTDNGKPRRLEAYRPGIAASVALLCGPGKIIPLPACRQRISNDGSFLYLGGSLPLSPDYNRRAVQLARRAIEAMPPATGYVGVDLVLGDCPDGGDDAVIEINPRPTTSYVGLRAAARQNLAAALLAIATGQDAELSFCDQPVEFDSDGEVRG